MLTVSKSLLKAREEGLQNLTAEQQHQKEVYDKNYKGSFYAVGTEVLKYDRRCETRQGYKLKPRYTGPYIIADALGKGVYKLKDPTSGNLLAKLINSHDLKRFRVSTDFPTLKKSFYLQLQRPTLEYEINKAAEITHQDGGLYKRRNALSLSSLHPYQPNGCAERASY